MMPPRWFRKNETVIGIIGKTHGVKIERRPKPNAARAKVPRLSVGAPGAVAALADGGGAAPGSKYPAGIAAVTAGAAESTVNVNAAEAFFGRLHSVSLQV